MKNNRPIEYQMTKKMFNSILNLRTEDEKSQNPYDFVMGFINEQFGLRGEVKHISIYEM